MRLTRLLTARKRQKAKKAASSPKQLVVGLRNPGADYEGTRHNVGYEVVHAVLQRSGIALGRAPSRVSGLEARLGFGADATLVLVPTTFMNESGLAVRSMLDYYKAETSDLLVVHDDIDLPFGRLRLQIAGGSGGHNGIRSLERSLGTKGFSRLKVGIGRPPGSMDPADFVLRRFSSKERDEIDVLVEDAADIVGQWLTDRVAAQEAAAHRGRSG